MEFEIEIDGQVMTARSAGDKVEIAAAGPGTLSVLMAGHSYTLRWQAIEAGASGPRFWLGGGAGEVEVTIRDPRRLASQKHFEQSGRVGLQAPMAGKVVRLLAAVGDAIERGQGLVVLEAMKMQNEVRSTKTGSVVALLVEPGQTVAPGHLLAEIE